MALAAELLGDRWTLLILREAFYGVQRYDDMRQDLSIPRSVLTDRLQKLTAHGLLARFEYQEVGDRKRHAYRLTSAGRALAPVMIAMTQWGERFLIDGPSPVGITDDRSGDWLTLRLVDEGGKQVSLENARMARRSPA
ncbi:winged helix-turn-helix transcriptional regulator [Hoeflea sp. TYP-13]|uniref:winged helix-turn-helix transcriptional regulator n=1 Tax=Hoeflea sp. TYP-13 TaxID=3230023 RepID=UPI0034C5B96B